MTQIENAWGAGPGPHYGQLAATFRPVFEKIGARAVARDLERALPHDEIRWLREVGFTRLRLPLDKGGFGVSLPELFALLIELGAADSNVVNALRAHLGFTEDVLTSAHAGWRDPWLRRLAEDELIGSGFSETGDAKVSAFSTRLTRKRDSLRLDGAKFYTTGSLFADWINVGATNIDAEPVLLTVPRAAHGVAVVDDWEGFGQSLTASGTATFEDVEVDPAWLNPSKTRFPYSSGFYQLVHLATLAGIGRAQADNLARLVRERERVYSHGNGERASVDPQVLQVVGKVRAAAYGAGAIVVQAATALQRVHDVQFSGDADATAEATAIGNVEVDQAVSVVTNLILDASTLLFDALGASAVKRSQGLDRYWRNARTISSHNPRIYRERQVGDYAVNGVAPPTFYRVGSR